MVGILCGLVVVGLSSPDWLDRLVSPKKLRADISILQSHSGGLRKGGVRSPSPTLGNCVRGEGVANILLPERFPFSSYRGVIIIFFLLPVMTSL